MTKTNNKNKPTKIFSICICLAIVVGGCAAGNTTSKSKRTAYASFSPMIVMDSCVSGTEESRGFHAFASAVIALEDSGWELVEVFTNDGKVKAKKCDKGQCASVLFHPYQTGELLVYPSNEAPHTSELLSQVQVWVDDVDESYKRKCTYPREKLEKEMDKFGFVFAKETKTDKASESNAS